MSTLTEGKTMHQFLEAVKHVIDAIAAIVAGVTFMQVIAAVTSIMTLIGATLSVIWYIIRMREYFKSKKVSD